MNRFAGFYGAASSLYFGKQAVLDFMKSLEELDCFTKLSLVERVESLHVWNEQPRSI
jgi:hypothetical protein